MSTITLANGKKLGDYTKPYIIAELGSNHNGKIDIAKELINQAKEAGCDCVKFQSWSKDTIFSEKVYRDNYFLNDDYRNRTDYTLKEIVEEFSLSEKELLSLKQYCDEIAIDFASSPFSQREVDFLSDVCKVPFIKVASMDLNNYPFLDYIAHKGLPILLSTGLSEASEIDHAIRTIELAGNNQIVLLHCISIYPPEISDINLNNILGMRMSYPEYPVGFSDHSLGVEIPTAAVALGACVIEKHFTLNKNMFGWDHKISADLSEMKQLVYYARNVAMAMGTTRKIVGEKELEKRKAFRRSIIAAKDLKKGDILSYANMDVKRPGTGIAPEHMNFLNGRVLLRDVAKDEILLKEDV